MIGPAGTGARIPHKAILIPALLFSFEDNLNEARGLLTMVTGGDPGLGQQQDVVTYTDSDTPATLGRSVVSAAQRRCWAANDSVEELCLGSTPFTFEGVCRLNTGQVGGLIATKNWYPSQPGTFNIDWSIEVSSTNMRFSWQTTAGGSAVTVTVLGGVTPPTNRDFTWAVADDGVSMRFYLDGALIYTSDSVMSQAMPPNASSAARVMLFGGLAGFLGSTPNLGAAGFDGTMAMFRYYKGTCKYTGSSMPALTDPAVV